MQDQRLFSRLSWQDHQWQHLPGNAFACATLIAGTTVGAGILALPAMTHPAGLVPSSVMLVGVWTYALVAALLLAEVNVVSMRHLGRTNIGLLSMVEQTLGRSAAGLAGLSYLFLHYALLVAYMAEGGKIFTDALRHTGWARLALPDWLGPIWFVVVFGGIVYFGKDQLVARLNTVFVAIFLVAFIGLLGLSATSIEPTQFLYQNWPAVKPAVSVMLVALFYHNVVPVVTTQLEGDLSKIRQAIVTGSILPLVMFLVWNAAILGHIQPEWLANMDQAAVFDPLEVLRNGQDNPGLAVMVAVFSEFAIATSFIGFSYGLLDFLRDVLRVSAITPSNRLPLFSAMLLPSLGVSTVNPAIFFYSIRLGRCLEHFHVGGDFTGADELASAISTSLESRSCPNLLHHRWARDLGDNDYPRCRRHRHSALDLAGDLSLAIRHPWGRTITNHGEDWAIGNSHA